MELARIIDALTRPKAYPYAVDRVDVCHTHISVVFRAGPFVYKIKKPVDMGFLNFSTLARRRYYCTEEVRLNRRLAPEVYLGVVPITTPLAPVLGGARPLRSPLSTEETEADVLAVEQPGDIVDWAVKMQRLPDEAMLWPLLLHDAVGSTMLEALARRIAAFHAQGDSSEHIAAFGRFEVVADNARENFRQTASQIGVSVSSAVFEQVRLLTDNALAKLRPMIESRARRGVPRDTHGDLRLDHVYVFPDRQPPADLVVIDCIEFNEHFRFSDPVADMAFLVMDLKFHGRCDLAQIFADAYFQASGDEEGRALLPFYTAYRAVVRSKVEGLMAGETEVAPTERATAHTRAGAYWLLALAELTKRPLTPGT